MSNVVKPRHINGAVPKAKQSLLLGPSPVRLVLPRVACPIGLPILAETPQQIAVSIVAELLVERAGTLDALRQAR